MLTVTSMLSAQLHAILACNRPLPCDICRFMSCWFKSRINLRSMRNCFLCFALWAFPVFFFYFLFIYLFFCFVLMKHITQPQINRLTVLAHKNCDYFSFAYVKCNTSYQNASAVGCRYFEKEDILHIFHYKRN